MSGLGPTPGFTAGQLHAFGLPSFTQPWALCHPAPDSLGQSSQEHTAGTSLLQTQGVWVRPGALHSLPAPRNPRLEQQRARAPLRYLGPGKAHPVFFRNPTANALEAASELCHLG